VETVESHDSGLDTLNFDHLALRILYCISQSLETVLVHSLRHHLGSSAPVLALSILPVCSLSEVTPYWVLVLSSCAEYTI